MKILFFGCEDFAATNLERLIKDGHNVVGLVTQPDRPKGRGMHVVMSPTKQLALEHGIPVFQPATLKDPAVIDKLREFSADLFVVIAYGKLLPPEVLSLPKIFCVNVHASLLPRYRGAAPINWAIINGETETGVTIIRLNPAMDAGAMLAQRSVPIPEDMTSAELRPLLARLGADMLSDLIARLSSGHFDEQPQDETRVTKAPKMHKDLGHIDWTKPAKDIHNLVRGVQPWPGAFTFWRGHMLKVLTTQVTGCEAKGRPGEIVALHKDGIFVQTGEGCLLVKRVHPASSKPMDARAFLAGHKLSTGEQLG